MTPLTTIDGINSGLDTTSIVDAIMAVERQPVDLLEQRQAETTNIITALKALQAKILGLNTQIRRLSQTRTFNATAVEVSDDKYLSASATGRIGSGAYDIQVSSLARNHQLASQGFEDQSASSFGTGTISIKVGSGSARTITIDSSNNSLIGIQEAINNADLGVQANIISDGSSSQPYRLLLVAKNSGAANKIDITSDLTGGDNLNYTTASFDHPEEVSVNGSSTAQISLGASAAYTGSENKIFSFTVRGTGSQTIGTDNVTIDWTDGTNSGSVIVSQADTEIELVGAGADGLKLSFGSGTLNEGDTFQVSTFAPTLQAATDAKISFGSSGTGGSPITVTSDSNTFSNVISGLTFTAKKETEPGESVTISTATDTAAIKTEIQNFIDMYNDVMKFIDDQNSFEEDSEEIGVLFGDRTVQIVQSSIRSSLSQRVAGIESQYSSLFSVGVRTNFEGQLTIRDNATLDKALTENLDDVIKLFTESGISSNTGIDFISASEKSIADKEYVVEITQAATRGRFQGSGIDAPESTPIVLNSSNNRLKFSVDGLLSNELVLTEKTYSSADELIKEIQEKIDSDNKIGNRGLTAEWVSTGTGTGYINLTSSTYGSASTVQTITSIASSAFTLLGLANGASHTGQDVAGTINGEAATGQGQSLTGNEGNPNTEGIKLRVTLSEDDLVDGADGTFTLSKGIGAKVNNLLDSLTATGDGLFDRRIRANQNQVDSLERQIDEYDDRLAIRRQDLIKRFLAQEELLGELSSQNTFLTTQLAQINANWSQITNNNRN